MVEKFYLETQKSVLGRSISYYSTFVIETINFIIESSLFQKRLLQVLVVNLDVDVGLHNDKDIFLNILLLILVLRCLRLKVKPFSC